MGKPIPYTVQAKLLHQISTITAHSDPSVIADLRRGAKGKRQFCGFVSTLDTGLTQ